MARKRRGRHEGGLSYNGNKKLYCASLSLGHDANDRRIRKKVYDRTKKGALDKLAELRSSPLAGAGFEAKNLSVGTQMQMWLDGASKLSPTTRCRYQGLLDNHLLPQIGPAKLAAVTVSHV